MARADNGILARYGFRISIVVACALLGGALAVPLFTGRIFPFGDLSGFHLPLRFLYQHALRSGDSFLWTSELNNGLYVHGEGQAGMAHPLHLLLYRFLPLVAALNLEMLSSYAVAFVGMWLMLERLGSRREAALAGATAFAFSGFTLVHLNHLNLVAVASHLPWFVWATDLLLRASTPRGRALGFAGVAVVLGSQLLLGFPQCVWITLVVVALFVLYRLTTGTPIRRMALLGAALAVGAMIGGVQILPTLDAARESYRAVPSMTFRLTYSLHPLNVIQLLSPYTFAKRAFAPVRGEQFVHEFGLYNGALSTLALFWIVMRWGRLRDKRLAGAWIGLAVLGLVLSLGRFGILYALLAQLPGVSGFRAPARHILILHFALAGIVALVVEDIMELADRAGERKSERFWRLAIPVTLSATTAVLGLLVARGTGPVADQLQHHAAAWSGPLLMAVTAALMVAAAKGYRTALPLLMLVYALDLSAWGIRYVWIESPTTIRAVAPAAGLPPAARPGDMVRGDLADAFDLNLYVLSGLRSSAAYAALVPPIVEELDDVQRLKLAGVNWVWQHRAWSPVDGPMPRARLVSDWRIFSSRVDPRTIDVSRTALVDVSPGETSGTPGTATVTLDRPGHLVIETEAPHPQLLVTTETYHPGWHAAVDGRQVTGVRMYRGYLGCVVPAGRQHVVFEFAPASARHGLWLTIAGVVAAMFGTWMVGRSPTTRAIPAPGSDSKLRV
jgi:hypothetical protein